MKKSPCKVAPGEASVQPERQPMVPRGGIGGKIPTQSGLSVEGGRGGREILGWHTVVRQVQDDGSKMMCGK